MILFTKYNKGKIYSKQTRTIIPIYIVGISQSQIKAGNFLSFRSSFHNPKIKSLDNTVHHLHSNTFPKRSKKEKKKKLPIKALNYCGLLLEPASMITKHFFFLFKLVKAHIERWNRIQSYKIGPQKALLIPVIWTAQNHSLHLPCTMDRSLFNDICCTLYKRTCRQRRIQLPTQPKCNSGKWSVTARHLHRWDMRPSGWPRLNNTNPPKD